MQVPEGIGPTWPIAYSYVVSTAIWLILLMGWVFHLLRFHQIRNPMHFWVSWMPFAKTLHSLVWAWFWIRYAESGDANDVLGITGLFLIVFHQCTAFLALLLVSKGWYITRIRLDPLEICFIKWALILIGLSLLGFIFISSIYVFGLAFIYIIVFAQLYSGVSLNIRGLAGLETFLMVGDEDSDPFPHSVAEECHYIDRKRALFFSMRPYFTFLIVNGAVNYLFLAFIFPDFFFRVIQEEIGWLVVVIGIGKSLVMTSKGRKRLLGIGSSSIEDIEQGRRVNRICVEEMNDEDIVGDDDDDAVEEKKCPFVIVQGPSIEHHQPFFDKNEGCGSVWIGVSAQYVNEMCASEDETRAALQRTVLEIHSLRGQHAVREDDPLPAPDSPHLQRYSHRRGAITRHSVHESTSSRRGLFVRRVDVVGPSDDTSVSYSSSHRSPEI